MNCSRCKKPMLRGEVDGKPCFVCPPCGGIVQIPMAGATMPHEAGARVARTERVNKYGNVKTEVDGVTFDSAAEARRYSELKLMEKAGEIMCLTLQPEYKFEKNGVLLCKYRADFSYRLTKTLDLVVEDVKGMKTPMYRLKKKMMLAWTGINIVEVE